MTSRKLVILSGWTDMNCTCDRRAKTYCLPTWLQSNLKKKKTNMFQQHIRFTPTGGPLFTSSLSSYVYGVDSHVCM